MKKNKNILVIAGVILLIILFAVLIIGKGLLKHDKDLVYNADYQDKELKGKEYVSLGMARSYSLEDIVLPYIDISSEYAVKANSEIKGLYDDLVKSFKKDLEGEQIGYQVSHYTTYKNGSILSVVITVEKGGTDVEQYQYYTYNFDLNNGTKVNYEDAYKQVGFTLDTIEKQAETVIKNIEQLSLLTEDMCPEGKTVNSYIEASIENYKEAVNQNALPFFLDENGKLNIVVIINMPVGVEEFPIAITLN